MVAVLMALMRSPVYVHLLLEETPALSIVWKPVAAVWLSRLLPTQQKLNRLFSRIPTLSFLLALLLEVLSW
jgi:hypothetical protein